ESESSAARDYEFVLGARRNGRGPGMEAAWRAALRGPEYRADNTDAPGGKRLASRARRPALRGIVSQLLDSAFGGSASGLVMALLENRRLSAEEAERIRKMIDDAQEEKR